MLPIASLLFACHAPIPSSSAGAADEVAADAPLSSEVAFSIDGMRRVNGAL